MKLCNIQVGGETHLAAVSQGQVRDLSAAGLGLSMNEVIAGAGRDEIAVLLDAGLPPVERPVFANVTGPVGKLVCIGLNYRSHAAGISMKIPERPIIFSKFADALAPAGAQVELPPWEQSYDYEAELVIVMGREAWNVSEEDAMGCVFGYTCGNDLSCRDAQMRSGQWLIGKTMPGFAPCGPYIVTADACDPDAGLRVRSFVNGELRQDGTTADMIFSCAALISYASRYLRLMPGDLIFTGTPSGVALEKGDAVRQWLRPGDRVDVEIEGIGTLSNVMI